MKESSNLATLGHGNTKVDLAARRTDRLADIQPQIRAADGDAIAIEMDVVDAASVKAGNEKLVAAYGTIDIAFNNAGLMPASDIETLKVSERQRMVDVNRQGRSEHDRFRAPLHDQAALASYHQHLVDRRPQGVPGLAVYCASS
jgi:NADP-dependent 3-hydroxy acid dehydrogenase YdfG